MIQFGEFSKRFVQESKVPHGPRKAGLFDVVFVGEDDEGSNGTRIRITTMSYTKFRDDISVQFGYKYFDHLDSEKDHDWNVTGHTFWIIHVRRNLKGMITFTISVRNPND